MSDSPPTRDGARIRVDRERFLVLALAMAAPACARAQGEPGAPPVVIAPIAPVSADAGALVVAPDPVEPSSPARTCEEDNDTGEVDCAWSSARGPTCEGMSGMCNLLEKGYAYRPRAAAAIARCFERAGARACSIKVRKGCFREGVMAACPEPRFEAPCAEAILRCEVEGKRVDYTKEECARSLSAQKERDAEWALGAMGPSAEGTCKLMFTVY